MNYPHVSILVLNWNNWEDTLECLESIYQSDYFHYNVLVIDNCSENDSINQIKNYCKGQLNVYSKFFDYNYDNKPLKFLEIKYKEHEFNKLGQIYDKDLILIENDKNYGYTEGNNIGVRFALNCLRTDYILIINNDTVVDNQLLKKMVIISEKEEQIVLTQPKLLYYEEPTVINTTGNKMDKFGAVHCRGSGELDTGKYDKFLDKNFFYASGACILIKKNFISEFKEYNLFDSILFAYHEDVDISFRAHIMGFKVVYCPEAICYHKLGSSLKDNYKKYYWVQRNNLRVLLKHYSFKHLIFIFPTTLIMELLFALMVVLHQRQLKYLEMYLKSIYWNIKNIRDTMEKRKIIQSKRKLSDKDLFKLMEKGSLKLSYNFRYFLKRYFNNADSN